MPIFNLGFLLRSPVVGSHSPVSSFNRVLLPAPLGPTMQILLSMSIPKSTFLKITGCFSEYRNWTLFTSMIGRESSATSANSNWTVYSLGLLMSAAAVAVSCPLAIRSFAFLTRAPGSLFLLLAILLRRVRRCK